VSADFEFSEFVHLAHHHYDNVMDQLAKARKAGTVGKIDRTAQYDDPEYVKPEELRKGLNCMGMHVRGLQADQGRMQRDLMNLKLRNGIIVAIVTAVLTLLGQWLLR
jgi:hypothetical protein